MVDSRAAIVGHLKKNGRARLADLFGVVWRATSIGGGSMPQEMRQNLAPRAFNGPLFQKYARAKCIEPILK